MSALIIKIPSSYENKSDYPSILYSVLHAVIIQ